MRRVVPPAVLAPPAAQQPVVPVAPVAPAAPAAPAASQPAAPVAPHVAAAVPQTAAPVAPPPAPAPQVEPALEYYVKLEGSRLWSRTPFEDQLANW